MLCNAASSALLGSDHQSQLEEARAKTGAIPPLKDQAMAKTAGHKVSLVDLPENVILKIQVAAGDPSAVYGPGGGQMCVSLRLGFRTSMESPTCVSAHWGLYWAPIFLQTFIVAHAALVNSIPGKVETFLPCLNPISLISKPHEQVCTAPKGLRVAVHEVSSTRTQLIATRLRFRITGLDNMELESMLFWPRIADLAVIGSSHTHDYLGASRKTL